MNSTQNFKTTVDVRSIVPRERHPLIFGSFDALSAGEALLLVNDHVLKGAGLLPRCGSASRPPTRQPRPSAAAAARTE